MQSNIMSFLYYIISGFFIFKQCFIELLVFVEFGLDEKIVDSYPLALAITQLLCDVLWLPQRKPHAASVSVFISISGKSLENYLQESLDIFLSEEAFLGYLEWLTASVTEWSGSEASEGQQEKEEFFYTSEDLRKCFKQKIPGQIGFSLFRFLAFDLQLPYSFSIFYSDLQERLTVFFIQFGYAGCGAGINQKLQQRDWQDFFSIQA